MRMTLLGLATVVASAAIAQADDYTTLKGQVVLKNAPKVEVIDVTTDKAVCCKEGDLLSSKFQVNPKTGAFANVVVWLRPDEESTKTFPLDKVHPTLKEAKSKEIVIDQPKCQFEPRVAVARAGDTLVVKNSATIPHNVNYKGDPIAFNVTIQPGKQHPDDPKASPIKLEASRTPIPFECNVHPWMKGFLRVFDHPYFAITDKDGKFTIPMVPAGKWRIVYWHEDGFHKGAPGRFGTTIEVKAGKEQEVPTLEFEFVKPK